jgi:hypothetical protein
MRSECRNAQTLIGTSTYFFAAAAGADGAANVHATVVSFVGVMVTHRA